VPDHFDFLASFYERVIPPPDPTEISELLRLPTTGRLLDAGGGTGRVSAGLRHQVGTLVVSDLSRNMLRQARAKEGLRPVRAHAETLPFPDASFDRVLVVDALHHFCDQGNAIRDLLRVLGPGGRLLIEEPDYTRTAVKFVAIAEKLALMRSRFYTPEAVAGMIEDLGFAASIVRDSKFRAWIFVDA
jgi:demethylmenaquinone methyltransferase/2-methoxy-6-polyprenyl-1,4-benzoquinol methylase